MSLIVPRTVTVVPDGRDARPGADGDRGRSAPLAEFRSERAYVLLGDPGAGKTEAFRRECNADPESKLATARRFISRSLDRHPEWKAETLFIDGLDEVRAGRPDARRPMDLILERLERLGSPNFRLSCRAADWLGRNDLQEIMATAGYGNVRVLHLEPLRGEDIQRILADLEVPDPQGFRGEARDRGLEGLLGNPHSLGLLVKAVGRGDWPPGRRATFEKACHALARERNDQHRVGHRATPLSLDRIMTAAGHLSALLLLSDKERVSLDPSEDPESLCLEDVSDGDQPALLRALKSNLFRGSPDGGFTPPHRQLAEFLGARFLHARIDSGVPASRVLALMTGEDGVVVTELRGLSAWLAAFDRPSRLSLVETDPVGIALYGDVGVFRGDELEAVLTALAERAEEIKPWSWPPVALASLIGQHTVQLLAAHLADDDRSEGRQAGVSLLLCGLAHASRVQPSHDRLEGTIRDATWQPRVRQSALRALLHHSVNRENGVATMRTLLDDIRDGSVEDRDGELRGTLLSALYPDHVEPGEIWDYLSPLPSFVAGAHYRFWSARLREEAAGSKVATRDVPALREEVELILTPRRASKQPMGVREKDGEYRLEEKRGESEFIAHVRECVAELREGRCAPRLLDRIARAYHDLFVVEPLETPFKRVKALLDGHVDLAESAMEGFRRVVEREDLPSLRDIIRLNENGQMSLFAYPLLAGLDRLSPEGLDARKPAEITRAAALYYLTPLRLAGHPKWYRWALESHPSAVAEAVVKVTRSRIRGRRDCLHLWKLAREPSHRAVARLAVPALLTAFPTRCTEPQVEALHEVLLAALRWKPEGMVGVIRTRGARSGMDVSQEALWLAAGLFLSPKESLQPLVEFIEDGEEARVRQLVRFLAPEGMPKLPMQWESEVLKTLIELLGSRYTPWRPVSSQVQVLSTETEDGLKVEDLIARWGNTLATRTDRDACDALQSLVDDPALEPWHQRLSGARAKQVVTRRNATFAAPELEAVQGTLANDRPANPVDLAALVADKLELLAKEISHGNTDDWQPYWSEDDYGRPIRPKREESCSKALVTALRRLLPEGVRVDREAVHARDKRADIRVWFGGHAVPVEVKKESHRDLWRAVANQLTAKYTIDPASSGFGIYLVLWFGLGRMPVPPIGRRPKTPESLRQRLEEQLTGPYRHKVRVIVIDVSGSSS